MNYRRVVKFGGSNLREAGDAARLAGIVRGYEEPPVVVVSALHGVTQFLIDALAAARADAGAPKRTAEQLRERYLGAARRCIPPGEELHACLGVLEARIVAAERLLTGLNLIGALWPPIHDNILAYGERLSSALLSGVFRDSGIDAAECLPEAAGLATDGAFGQATVDLERSAGPVAAALPPGRVWIVPGFYGIALSGEPSLLGRGGSDYTAAALAYCLDAQSCDLWKDVDGFMSADPRSVVDAVPLKRLSYAEAAELAYFGAKIIHPQTINPVERKNIPLRLFNIVKDDTPAAPVSEIGPAETTASGRVKSVSASDDFCILRLSGPGVGGRAGVLGSSADRLAEAGINIKSVITSQTSINILLSDADLERAAALIEQRHSGTVDRIEAIGRLSLVAAVGEGMLETPGLAGRMFAAVAAAGVNMRLISVGASPVAAYCIVARPDRNAALLAIHKEFFPPPS